MSQQEVLSYLKKHKRDWFTVAALSKVLGGHAGTSCRKLRRTNMIDIKIIRVSGKGSKLYSASAYKWK